jgi:hypothetical protein
MANQEASFSNEEILQQAQGVVNAMILVTAAYVKKQGLSASDWVEFAGNQLAPGWEQLRGQGAKEIARVAALNGAAAGGSLRSLAGDDARGEAVINYRPPQEMLDAFGVTQDEADGFFDAFAPIARYLGMSFSWERQGDEVRLVFSR